PDGGSLEIGRYPTAHGGLLAGAIITALIAIATYLGTTFSTRPWYMRKRVVHTGGGRIHASPALVDSR
ncbi:MAG: hypothetical protein WCJ30_04900, partial [Deltaproteobacteria bacterium]